MTAGAGPAALPAAIDTSALDEIRWDRDGLVPVIAQDAGSRRVLMVAWMNREALVRTVAAGEMIYWSRSRQRLWHKGETSGNVQRLVSLRLDCDGDLLLAEVEQHGVACHTGRRSCLYRRLSSGGDWQTDEPVVMSPETLYGAAARKAGDRDGPGTSGDGKG